MPWEFRWLKGNATTAHIDYQFFQTPSGHPLKLAVKTDIAVKTLIRPGHSRSIGVTLGPCCEHQTEQMGWPRA